MIERSLAAIGVEALRDGAAEAARSDSDNIHARVGDPDAAPVAFFVHMDTVPHEGPIEVAISDGIYRSCGDTILGADNKAAVAVVLELARELQGSPRGRAAEVVFTVAEEQGLRGAHAFDVGRLEAISGFVMDLASDVGEIVVSTPTFVRLDARFSGTEAHAGLRPEVGASAIEAAARAIAAMDLGRLDEKTTANVGTVHGGSATNVVAGRCEIEAEARSRDHDRAHGQAQAMLDACTWAASEVGCEVAAHLSELFRGYDVPGDSPALAMAERALDRHGHEVRRVPSGGGSDANALRAKGFDAVLLANGTRANHTADEHVAAERLDEMVDVCLTLCEGGG
jgi:tripeptide aminopeptidase